MTKEERKQAEKEILQLWRGEVDSYEAERMDESWREEISMMTDEQLMIELGVNVYE